jgi:hypothetical protein
MQTRMRSRRTLCGPGSIITPISFRSPKRQRDITDNRCTWGHLASGKASPHDLPPIRRLEYAGKSRGTPGCSARGEGGGGPPSTARREKSSWRPAIVARADLVTPTEVCRYLSTLGIWVCARRSRGPDQQRLQREFTSACRTSAHLGFGFARVGREDRRAKTLRSRSILAQANRVTLTRIRHQLAIF